ncbi:MAG TPA: acetolactate synthase small subunit, partial [Steroidobacteraceae bacterium]|nr:acetolactate synthase small subunit [Steroidobacteraceae bacterium]
DASLSRMTIVTSGSDDIVEQITKHLNRLIEVVKVVDLTEAEHTERELMLIKLRAVGKEREEMKRMADIFRGRIIDVTERTYTIELTGATGKLDAFIRAVDRTAILETVRTGSSGIGRGERILRV